MHVVASIYNHCGVLYVRRGMRFRFGYAFLVVTCIRSCTVHSLETA